MVVMAASASVGAQPAAMEKVVDCAGGDAAVTGDNQSVVIKGACHGLSVTGNGNTVQAELAPAAKVDVRGDHNRVRYRLIGGTREAVASVYGQGDVVGPDAPPVAGEAAPATRPPLILGAGAPANADCTDRDVSLNGDGGTYTLHGGCRSLTVSGNGITVNAEMQPQARIEAPGQSDRVLWFLAHNGPAPQTGAVGQGSQILQQQRLGSVIAPSSAVPDTGGQAPLLVSGSGDQQCDGQDAQIQADNATIVLHGRCRSVSVTGNNDKVAAEMLSGSRIRITGHDTIVQFALVDTGPDPIVSVSGDHSSAWRIQRLGADSRATASVGVSPTGAGMKVQGGAGASVTQMPAVPQPAPE
jgi:hypothetical protein